MVLVNFMIQSYNVLNQTAAITAGSGASDVRTRGQAGTTMSLTSTSLMSLAWVCLGLLGFAWVCLDLLGRAWLCLGIHLGCFVQYSQIWHLQGNIPREKFSKIHSVVQKVL
jgi:hypothetical protein